MAPAGSSGGDALAGGLLQAISHAPAKGAMFTGRRVDLRGAGPRSHHRTVRCCAALPLSVTAFALGGIALMGVPPSGASVAKDLLLQAADNSGQWWWAIVLQAGGMLTAAYVVLVLAHALAASAKPITLVGPHDTCETLAPFFWRYVRSLLGLVPWNIITYPCRPT